MASTSSSNYGAQADVLAALEFTDFGVQNAKISLENFGKLAPTSLFRGEASKSEARDHRA